jgi:hypothetical protein
MIARVTDFATSNLYTVPSKDIEVSRFEIFLHYEIKFTFLFKLLIAKPNGL